MMKITELQVAGCYQIGLEAKPDQRGYFIKTFINSVFQEAGLAVIYGEDFFTSSKKNVLRGMHFQLPPRALIKTVYCLSGRVLDVILDLRVKSPTYLKTESLILSEEAPRILYLPAGIAHGFLSLKDDSIVCYKVDQEYDSTLDSGIRWDSFGFKWPVTNPIVSSRDNQLPTLQEFANPFVFNEEH